MVEMSQHELANVFGVDKTTIRDWVSKGCPIKKRGGRGQAHVYDPSEVIKWREDNAVKRAVGNSDFSDTDELQRRKLVAQTQLIEMEAAQKRGELVLVDDYKRELMDACVEVRAKMMTVPRRASQRLYGFDGEEREIEDIIKDEVCIALEAISGAGVDE